MTRINVVPASELEDMHLLAEYRELPRVFKLATAYHAAGKKSDFPTEYVLGTGHVKFFYNRLLFLAKRQQELVKELLLRGFNIQFTNAIELLEGCPKAYCNDWTPSQDAIRLNKERIDLRLREYYEKRSNK